MSEVYSYRCYFKIPLSPFAKGGSGKGFKWFQYNSCDNNGCLRACFSHYRKGGRGDFVLSHTLSKRNAILTYALEYPNFVGPVALRIDHVHRAGDAGVEGVNGAENF